MAIRLPVVLAQHAKRVAAFTDCEESWITSLLFEERLDATLVADLTSIAMDSTDYLCLNGIKGDFVLVTWCDSSIVLRELVRLGFESFEIIPVDGSAKSTSPVVHHNIKKIYLMAFNPGVSVGNSVGQLKTLLESKSTPVFQLQIAPKASVNPKATLLPVLPMATGSTASALSPGTSNTINSAQMKSPGNDTKPQIGESNFAIREPLPTGISNAGNIAYEEIDDFPHIDSLVDELDRFDF